MQAPIVIYFSAALASMSEPPILNKNIRWFVDSSFCRSIALTNVYNQLERERFQSRHIPRHTALHARKHTNIRMPPFVVCVCHWHATTRKNGSAFRKFFSHRFLVIFVHFYNFVIAKCVMMDSPLWLSVRMCLFISSSASFISRIIWTRLRILMDVSVEKTNLFGQGSLHYKKIIFIITRGSLFVIYWWFIPIMGVLNRISKAHLIPAASARFLINFFRHTQSDAKRRGFTFRNLPYLSLMFMFIFSFLDNLGQYSQ